MARPLSKFLAVSPDVYLWAGLSVDISRDPGMPPATPGTSLSFAQARASGTGQRETSVMAQEGD